LLISFEKYIPAKNGVNFSSFLFGIDFRTFPGFREFSGQQHLGVAFFYTKIFLHQFFDFFRQIFFQKIFGKQKFWCKKAKILV